MSPTTIPVGPDESVKVAASKRDPKRVSFVKDGDVKQKVIDKDESFTSEAALVIEHCVPEEPAPGVLHDNVPRKATSQSSSSSSKKSSSSKSTKSSSSSKSSSAKK